MSAIRKALGICGFGTPRDAEYIEGVTVVYEIGKAPEQPVDTGRALNRLPVPPTPKISTTGRQSGTERTESPDNPQNEPASEVQTQKTHNGKEYCAETKEEFMNGYLDKKQCFEPDPVLMEQILNMFDTYCEK